MLYQISIDGFSGVGKSVVAKKLAEKLGFLYINTGIFFRSITYLYLNRFLNQDIDKLVKELNKKKFFVFKKQEVFLDGVNITKELFNETINKNVGIIASNLQIRQYILKVEHYYAEQENVVMEGRDIGSTVLKNATLKIFLNAKIETRALRRYDQLNKNNKLCGLTLKDIEDSIAKRDFIDSTREHSPTIKCFDAIEIFTDNISIEKTVDLIYEEYQKVMLKN